MCFLDSRSYNNFFFSRLLGWTMHSHVKLLDFLKKLASQKQLHWLYRQVLFQIAMLVEFHFHRVPTSTDPLTAAQHTWHRRKDPAMRHALSITAMRQGWAKNSKRLARSAKAVGRNLGSSSPSLRFATMAAYYWACKRAMAGSRLIARAGDAARIGQKRLVSAVMDLDSGVACWAAPKAFCLS